LNTNTYLKGALPMSKPEVTNVFEINSIAALAGLITKVCTDVIDKGVIIETTITIGGEEFMARSENHQLTGETGEILARIAENMKDALTAALDTIVKDGGVFIEGVELVFVGEM
jgi:hypothetical protein